jgi:hypothetical protein
MDRRLIYNSELNDRWHFLNNFTSANDIKLWISSLERASFEASMYITLINVINGGFIPILFSFSIFVNFHDKLTLNYT